MGIPQLTSELPEKIQVDGKNLSLPELMLETRMPFIMWMM